MVAVRPQARGEGAVGSFEQVAEISGCSFRVSGLGLRWCPSVKIVFGGNSGVAVFRETAISGLQGYHEGSYTGFMIIV